MAQGCLAEDEMLAVATQRKNTPEVRGVLNAVGRLHVHGLSPDWRPLFAGARRLGLPTYAFQRDRYWLESGAWAGDLEAVGIDPAGHPLLGAALRPAGSDTVVFTGRWSLRTHPWLAGHAVLGQVILPATGYIELAVHAGDRTGCGHLAELTLQTPLVLPEQGAVQVQFVVEEAQESGRRAFSVYSRPAGGDDPWERHAQGVLAPQEATAPDSLAEWPPPGAEQVTTGGHYEGFAAGGFDYTAAFQGLKTVWRRGEEIFAEVALPEPYRADAARFTLHPALLDAAVQSLLVEVPGAPREEGTGGAMLPFAWSGFSLYAEGATDLRVRLSPAGHPNGFSVLVADTAGTPVAAADALTLRVVAADQIQERPTAGRGLLRLDWRELTAGLPVLAPESVRWIVLGHGDDRVAKALDLAGVHLETYADLESLGKAVDTNMAMPPVVLVTPGARVRDGHGVPDAVRGLLRESHDICRFWLEDERFADSRLVFVTREAVAADPAQDVRDLAGAALWGMVRSAQAENPDRFQLVDIDDRDDSERAVPAVVAAAGPQAVIRDGRLFLPGLARVETDPAAGSSPLLPDGTGTVLVTGATGALGRLVARHLVTGHGVRSLLLASRSGSDAPHAAELVAELTGHGAQVRLESCDVTDRTSVEALIAQAPDGHPLSAVVHVAGVLDDGTMTSLDSARFDRVLRPKADAAWLLHEATADLDLSAFVLFSSVAGTFGSPGQANYAAANTFLDALAARRRAHGLPGTSVAWGSWADNSSMTANLADTDRRRMARGGMRPLSAEDGLALFDAAFGTPVPALVAMDVEGGRNAIEALMRPASATPSRRSAAGPAASADALPALLAGLTPDKRRETLVGLVRERAAAVLGHASVDSVEADRLFTEQGFDSLTAVELRNQLASATGLKLLPTLLFDYATAEALAGHLDERLLKEPGAAAAGGPAEAGAQIPVRAEDTLGGLFKRACEMDKVDQGFELLQAAARLRPTFSTPDELPRLTEAVRLTAGTEGTPVVCFSSYVALAGVHQYARFASAFRGERDVWAMPTQGFGTGQLLPESLDAVAALLAESVLRTVGDGPVVLLGSSSGGVLALATAVHLEKAGHGPSAVVLLDTYMPRADSPFLRFSQQMLGGMFDRESMFAHMDSDRLTAMSWYISMIGEWEPDELSCPVLLVRSSEPPLPPEITGPMEPAEWQASWERAHTVIDVTGNHFTMVEAYARNTALVTSDWLGSVGS